MTARLKAFWEHVPFRHMTFLVIALFVIKEQFPFSNFPMYSNFDSEADVVYIANQNGDPLAMDDVFRSGSSTAKKAYKKELGKITQAAGGRDSNDANAEERMGIGGSAALSVRCADADPFDAQRKVPLGSALARLGTGPANLGAGRATPAVSEGRAGAAPAAVPCVHMRAVREQQLHHRRVPFFSPAQCSGVSLRRNGESRRRRDTASE
jgi:hypothetical protein